MHHSESYHFLLSLSPILALPLVIGIKTLLASKERIIIPLFRMLTKAGDRQAITYRRSVRREGTSRPRSYVIVAPAKFTQPRRSS